MESTPVGWGRGGFLALVVLIAGLALWLTSCSPTSSTGTSQMHGGNFNLSGKTAAESLETLRTVSSTAPVGVFYLGDRYTGLRLFQVRSGPQGYDGPVIVRYQADVGDMWVEVSTYTAEQFAKDNPLPTGTPAKTVPAKASPDAVYRQRQPPLTYLVARRGDAIVVVAGNLWGIDTQPIPEAGTHLGSVVP